MELNIRIRLQLLLLLPLHSNYIPSAMLTSELLSWLLYYYSVSIMFLWETHILEIFIYFIFLLLASIFVFRVFHIQFLNFNFLGFCIDFKILLNVLFTVRFVIQICALAPNLFVRIKIPFLFLHIFFIFPFPIFFQRFDDFLMLLGNVRHDFFNAA